MRQAWCPSGEPVGSRASDTLKLAQMSERIATVREYSVPLPGPQRSKGAWPES
jgi:hypothetical protein